MYNKVLILFLIFNFQVFGLDSTKIIGETSYTRHKTETLNTSLIFEYNIKIYEPKHKKWELNISGKLNPQYDHFGNEIRMDAFTVLGISF